MSAQRELDTRAEGADEQGDGQPVDEEPSHAGLLARYAKVRSQSLALCEPLENEVDRILDKISEQGLESLTDEEKRLLDEASRQ